MAGEVEIQRVDLIPQLARVIQEIAAGAVFRVMEGDECWFVLGPHEICGRVLGLVDAEYGWPVNVELSSIRSIEDLGLGYRSHPFVMHEHQVVAVAVSPNEYDMILRKPE
jgi:hypothetical protein